MSERLSTGLPRACSGLMCAAVREAAPIPVIIPGDVIVDDIEGGRALDAFRSALSAFARPKSSTSRGRLAAP